MPKVATDASALARLAKMKDKLSTKRLTHAFEREGLLVLCLGLSLFHWTALSSHSPLDASWMTAVYPGIQPKNLAGTYGAHLSSTAIYMCGLVAWLLPAPLLSVAVAVFRKRDNAFAPTRLVSWLLILMGTCISLALGHPHVRVQGFDLPSGGSIGFLLSQALSQTLGLTGSIIALSTLTLVALLWLLRRPLIAPGGVLLQKVMTHLPKLSFPSFVRGLFKPSPPQKRRAEQGSAPQDLGARTLDIRGGDDLTCRSEATLEEPALGLPGVGDAALRQHAMRSPDVAPSPFSPTASPRLESPLDRYPSPDPTSTTAYTPPPLSVFNRADGHPHQLSTHELEATSALLVKTFDDFGVMGKVIGYQPGPVVTVYEFQADAGVKQSKVLGLIDDLALALKVDSIFIHPVRGKSALGVQVPNSKREAVHLGDILGTATFRDAPSPLSFGLGKTITGQPMCADLTAMPHLLVAGATGSGKSVGINALLCSIIMKATPEQVRMILVDPKMLELSVYEGIPHLLMPVITEPSKASLALKWAASEMERRYRLMQLACVRNIEGFNDFWSKASAERKTQLREALDDPTLERLPYILLVIDELADLMMTAPKDVEAQIQRLAQKARASGIHMVLATQRPSVDIITGVIKANLPCRIAYQVVSKHDSRTILDLIGAEKLLGKGDFLFQKPGSGRLERLQGALITDEEVLNLVASVKATSAVQYDEKIIGWIDDEFARQKDGGEGDDMASGSPDDEPKFNEAMALARAHGVVSASFLQRHLKIGYNRAARIVEFMESKGLVDKADGAKPRKWLG